MLDDHRLRPYGQADPAWLAGQGLEELDRLLGMGAAVVSRPEQHGEDWWVLADPESNQFCAFPPGR